MDKLERLEQKKQRIISQIGKEKFESLYDALKKLDTAPFILLDIVEYYRLEDLIPEKKFLD